MNDDAESFDDQLYGVATFDTEELLVLVQAEVESVAVELARQKGAKIHIRDVLGEEQEITIADPCYLVLRLAGSPWTLIAPCIFSPKSQLSVADAEALSKELATHAIFFANSDTASYTEYELFEAGKSVERFECGDAVKFTSQVRDVPPPEDGPDIYEFVDAFFREQRAYLPPLSIELNLGGMRSGKKIDLADQMDDMEEDDFERIDYVAGG